MALNAYAPDITLETARLGVEAANLRSSNIGRYLMERAQLEVDTAKDALVHARSMDEVRELQNRIHIANQFPAWVEEAIAEGLLAAELIESSGE